MHVALVHLRHAETGGTERYLNQLSSHLIEAGHRVSVLCRSHARGPYPGVQFIVLRRPVPGKSLRVLAFARDVTRHLRHHAYDVVLGLGWGRARDVVRLGGGCLATHRELALQAARSPWERVLPAVPLKHRIAERLEKDALTPGNYLQVIVNSEMVRRDAMQRHAIPEGRIHVVYNGVDLERFDREPLAEAGIRLRADLGFRPEHRLLLFVGSSYGRKGLDALLASMTDLAATRPDLRLLVVGGDSRRREYERRARRSGIAELCRFVGALARPDAAYAAADLFVLPTHYDPFANVTLEALASGLPVITSSANGASEILDPSRHGSIVAPSRSVELSTAILAWCDRARDSATRATCRSLAQQYPATRTASESTRILEIAAAERRRLQEASLGSTAVLEKRG